jgi:iron complex transport system substrate-binding protein
MNILNLLKKYLLRILIVIPILSFFGCESEKKDSMLLSDKVELSYAEGFSIAHGAGFWEIEVTQPWTGSEETFHYLVLEENQEVPLGNFDAVIQLPISKVVLTSTTQIPHLDLLRMSEKLIGFPQLDLISSEITRKLIDAGKVQDLGAGPAANPELIVELDPDWIMISTLGEDLRYLDFFKTAEVPAIINGEYVEQHPLGRAEWIKFTGILLGKYEESKLVFEQVERDYLEAVSLGATIFQAENPIVLSGVMYQDIWYAPGSESWGAQILKNAGGNYVFEDQSGTGSLQLNYEFVLEQAMDADFWIGSADFASLEKMGELEPRYQAIKAFQSGKVFTYTQKKGVTGGLEYFELGYMRPDLILKDLMKILYPDLLPEYELYFYKQLNEK